jgi:hypothetical protein
MIGHRQKIAQAKTVGEAVDALGKAMSTCTNASEATQRSWQSTYDRVVRKLSQPKKVEEAKPK